MSHGAIRVTRESTGASRESPTFERVDRYIDMYVNRWTIDMGPEGAEAPGRLYRAGKAAGLCPEPAALDPA